MLSTFYVKISSLMKDKYDWILEKISHPENLNKEAIDTFRDDKDLQELYSLLCKTADACTQPRTPDIDAEWHKFAIRHKIETTRRTFHIFSSKAAAVFIGIFVSIAVVAATIGIRHALQNITGEDNSNSTETLSQVDDESVSPTCSEPASTEIEPVIFKNTTLDRILREIADHYGYEISVNNGNSLELKLYFRWDKSLSIEEIVEQLNNFEQLHLTLDGNTLAVN